MMSSNLVSRPVSQLTNNQLHSGLPSDGYGAPLAPPSSSYGPPPSSSGYSPPSTGYFTPTSSYSPPGSGQGGTGGFPGTIGGIPGRNVPDVVDMIESGVSDAFCASARSFNTRNAKILFDETLFEKGKMFSLADGDFKVTRTTI